MGAVINYYGIPGEEWKIKATEPICLHCGSVGKYYAIDGIH
jgi:ribosomal protein S27AE